MRAFYRFLNRCQNWVSRRTDRPPAAIVDPGFVSASTLRHVARTFVDGFSIATEIETGRLGYEIGTMAATDRGVGYEGAAAGKAVLDLSCSHWSECSMSRGLGDERMEESSEVFEPKLTEAGYLLKDASRYSFLLFLGIGEAMAQLKLPPVLCNDVARELWSGQIIEGYGFFDGYFNWYEALVLQKYPTELAPVLRAAYDQGLGRAIYFISNCSAAKIREQINTFPIERRAELWAGVGIPAAYVGGLTERELARLIDFAGSYRAELMQGVLLGSDARAKQLLIPDHTDMACNIICGARLSEAMELNSQLTSMLAERESYSMYDWQMATRRILRIEAC